MGIDEAIQILRLEMPFTKEDVERNYNILLKEYTLDPYKNAEMFLLLTDARELVLDCLPMELKNSDTIPSIKDLKLNRLHVETKLIDDNMKYLLQEGTLQHFQKDLTAAISKKKHICKLANHILLLSSASDQKIVSHRQRICLLLNAISFICAFTIYHYLHFDITKIIMLVMMAMTVIHLLLIIISSYLCYRSTTKFECYHKQFYECQCKVESLKRKLEKEKFQIKEYDLIIHK